MNTMIIKPATTTSWLTVCTLADLSPNTGVCALVAGKQVAIFNCQRSGALYAIDNYDPIGNANILSRGIIGSINDQPVVASPLYKQHFHLKTGVCLEEPKYSVSTYSVRNHQGFIQIKLSS
ncbi:nitrite reductase small subunit NirD [Vibrio agarivorans]|uniref:Nitrite reductase small subunit NirD n=1 Tax=Vibrio agarivorans TaxID=153622 RepID=A0ABT7Y0I1_9VIBR|nr:nitrite reductase small subunit NirD [Vibrio agarivorans]MDN2481540.1 nitrite reductase small subunit NirD [Vibrio agarivorans]